MVFLLDFMKWISGGSNVKALGGFEYPSGAFFIMGEREIPEWAKE